MRHGVNITLLEAFVVPFLLWGYVWKFSSSGNLR